MPCGWYLFSVPKRHLRRIQDVCETLQTAADSLETLAAARDLRESAEQLELEAVKAARNDGQSWSRIGAIYGLTKQGAQQRFATVASVPAEPGAESAPRRGRKGKKSAELDERASPG